MDARLQNWTLRHPDFLKLAAMSGMGDGYVGTAADAAKIRRLEKQREADKQQIEELKKKSAQGLQGLLQFGAATSEVQ